MTHAAISKILNRLKDNCSAVNKMANHLAKINMGQKKGTVVPLSEGGEGELGPHLIQCANGQGLPPYQVAS